MNCFEGFVVFTHSALEKQLTSLVLLISSHVKDYNLFSFPNRNHCIVYYHCSESCYLLSDTLAKENSCVFPGTEISEIFRSLG